MSPVTTATGRQDLEGTRRVKLFGYSAAVAGALALAAGAAQAQPAGDAVKGKALFNQQCALCHSATAGVEGAAPSLHDVFGRKAAGEAKYPGYSKALKASAVVWTAPNLDAFLANRASWFPAPPCRSTSRARPTGRTSSPIWPA